MSSCTDEGVVSGIAKHFRRRTNEVEAAYRSAPRNVRTVLRRQFVNTTIRSSERPVCRFIGEAELTRTLGALRLDVGLLTLARIYDEAHIALCKAKVAAERGKSHNERFLKNQCVDLRPLITGLDEEQAAEHQIKLEESQDSKAALQAVWVPVSKMCFDELPRITNLADVLPGEKERSHEYAGIGGGGGSDVISASLIGLLLRKHNKEMNLLVSTRTYNTGSQGKNGSKSGVKRTIHGHGGHAKYAGKDISGTYLITKDTKAEGRDLEHIPVSEHKQVFMVLDQSESRAEIPEHERANLPEQYDAILAQARKPPQTMVIASPSLVKHFVDSDEIDPQDTKDAIDTVVTVDTGGDVFGSGAAGHATPDQDLRVQKAIYQLVEKYNLVTAVVAPGVDAPASAPRKAKEAGGMVYQPDKAEQELILDALVKYGMDGSDPDRYGKTTLALQARLKGILGWTSLDLPEYVINTWENPWSSFVYIQECMSDIIFMPTKDLLPLIESTRRRGSSVTSHIGHG